MGQIFVKPSRSLGSSLSTPLQKRKRRMDENDFDVSEAEPEDNLSIDDPLEVDLHSVMEKGETVSLPPHVRFYKAFNAFTVPTVEKMFRRYNTSLPSSAPVERVFSYAGMILSPKRLT
ncbi:hypothetical protein Ocin01_19102 [Orchesella cincta]|uniref:HAT C-terminal dimerisation domain-containing protein n=1 Tax=Orchesella cincta TaxID=48709 RepID=A0A1D2M3N4_ORCCI|nr:hypothetical protein Ocin01_19102 [Orchesella cincta]